MLISRYLQHAAEDGGLTSSQIRALDVVRQVTACFSVIGSSLVLYMIYNRSPSPYHRLMIGLSICDLLLDFSALWGIAAVPAELPLPGARGTTQTCEAQGFILHFSILAIALYNASILVFYVAVIRNGLRNRKFGGESYERWGHVVSLVLPFIFTVIPLCLDLINPAAGGIVGCAIDAYPPHCSKADTPYECIRGRDPHYFILFLTLVPMMLSTGVIYVSLVMIYCFASKKERSQRRFSLKNARSFGEGSVDRNSGESTSDPTQGPQNNATSFSVYLEMKSQAAMYALVFLNTYIYTILFLMLEFTGVVTMSNAGQYFSLSVIIAFFFPLQGLFNFLIFVRPFYIKTRRRLGPEVSSLRVLWSAIRCLNDET